MLDAMTAAPISPASAAQDPQARTVARPARELDSRSLRAVFFDLLGRPPFEAERERWLTQGLAELLDELLGSEAHWKNWLEEELYYFFLIDNFRPETESIAGLPGDLARGSLDARDAIQRIALSSSFELRNPGADTYVTVVMEQLCGMNVQQNARELAIGKGLYDGSSGRFLGASGSSQSDVVAIAVGSKRFATTFVERSYRSLVRAEPERGDVASWSREFHKDPRSYLDLVRSWLLSEAYPERVATLAPQPNRMFVKALFVDLLDRLPDESEARRMRTALDGLSDPGPLRSVLARLLLDSGTVDLPAKAAIADPTAWIAAWFPKLLGRGASEEELQAFTSAFHEPETRPETVLYALVSHPAYHRY